MRKLNLCLVTLLIAFLAGCSVMTETESTTEIDTSAAEVETIDEDKVIDIGGGGLAPKKVALKGGVGSP